jgi:hypothetical protein
MALTSVIETGRWTPGSDLKNRAHDGEELAVGRFTERRYPVPKEFLQLRIRQQCGQLDTVNNAQARKLGSSVGLTAFQALEASKLLSVDR